MQQIIPYLAGAPHPLGSRLANSQKCLRTQDISDIGDNRHLTFFEMLGDWSLNDFFKEEQLSWIFEFLTQIIGLDPHRLYVTVFGGSSQNNIPRDQETTKIWKEIFSRVGIVAQDAEGGQNPINSNQKSFIITNQNWWSRSGNPTTMPEGELGGPDSEIFWDFGAHLKLHENSPWANQPCHVNCDCGRFLEIGNNVFMEYIKRNGTINKIDRRNVDFGGGLERIAMACSNEPDVFRIDLFIPIIKTIEILSGKTYGIDYKNTSAMRIIADHLRSAIFLINDGVIPSNKTQGYFARRLIRRAIIKGKQLGIEKIFSLILLSWLIKFIKEFMI